MVRRRKPVLASKDSVRAGTLMAYVNNIKAHKYVALIDDYPLEEIFEFFVEEVGVENLPMYLDIKCGDRSTSNIFANAAEIEAEREKIQHRWRAMILATIKREK